MKRVDRFLQVLLLIGTLLTVIVPTYVAYDQLSKGTIPEKQIELQIFHSNDPMRDLSALGDKAGLAIRVGDQTVDNLKVSTAHLRNVGSSPVLPADFHQNLSINVEKPWKILAVENSIKPYGIDLKWKKMSDISFEAEPALLNPSDIIMVNIYITNTQFHETISSKEKIEPKIIWKTRIANLRGFTNPLDNFQMLEKGMWGIIILLTGWGVPFVIITTMVFQAIYMYLLPRAGFLQPIRSSAILILLGVNLLSLAAAESMNTYLFPSYIFRIFGTPHLHNIPWIILNWLLIYLLYRKARLKSTN